MYGSHHLNELFLGLILADDVVLTEEVRRHGDQRVLRPPTEPVHRAAGDQSGKLQRPVPKLLSDLSRYDRNDTISNGGHTEKQQSTDDRPDSYY